MAPALKAEGQSSKLRILCLHGFLQSGEVFWSRIGSLRKGLKSRAEFIVVDAPHKIDGSFDEQLQAAGGTRDSPRAWFRWEDSAPGVRPSRARKYLGWEDSLEVLCQALKEHQPVDGLLGFSQGATAAALLLAEARVWSNIPLPRFGILVGGFLPMDDTKAAALLAARPATPTLFVWGAADQLVPPERSAQLMATFAEGTARSYEHPGAHMVPTCSGEFKRVLVELLDGVAAGGEKA